MRVADKIKSVFRAGEVACETGGALESCPWIEGSVERDWWTRGYTYCARLLRAHEAEAEVKRLTSLCDRMEREIKSMESSRGSDW